MNEPEQLVGGLRVQEVLQCHFVIVVDAVEQIADIGVIEAQQLVYVKPVPFPGQDWLDVFDEFDFDGLNVGAHFIHQVQMEGRGRFVLEQDYEGIHYLFESELNPAVVVTQGLELLP